MSEPYLLDLATDVLPQAREALCRMFYTHVYQPAFPKAEVAETPDVWLPLMDKTELPSAPALHLVLALRQAVEPASILPSDLLGGAIFECFHASRVTLLTYICVTPVAQSRGVARALVQRVRARAEQHARGEPPLLLAETENPAFVTDPQEWQATCRRLLQLDALGFQRVNIDYLQPPLAPHQAAYEGLVLIAYAPDGEEIVAGTRLRGFLDEFAASLAHHRTGGVLDLAPGLGSGAEIRWLRTSPLTSLLPWGERPSLGTASAISLRFTFICKPIRFDARDRNASRLDPRPVTLTSIARTAELNGDVREFLEPMRSFSADITISEEGSRRLPLVSLCELPPVGERQPGTSASPVENRIQIELPQALVTDWENESVTTELGPSASAMVRFSARMVDTISIFATNQIAYSISFLMDEEDEGCRADIHTARLLTMLSLAGSAGAPSGDRWRAVSRQVRFISEGRTYELHQVAAARLRAMCLHGITDPTEREALLKSWAQQDLSRGLGRTEIWALPPDNREVFGTLLRKLAQHFSGSEHAAAMHEVRTALCSPEPGDMQGGTLEIVGYDAFLRARQTIEAAGKRCAPLTHYTRMLSGLAQAVIDFDDQDRHEVNDSLLAADTVGDYIHFVHRYAVVRLYRTSRSFDRMKWWVGGCPYFFLSTLCAAFNERLVRDANRAIAQIRPDTAAVGFSLPLGGQQHAEQARRIEERFHFFESFEADVIPDLFRYPSELELFRMIERQRGTALQRQEGRRLLGEVERFERERSAQSREWVEALLTAAVVALTVWQVFGVVWDAGGKKGDAQLGEMLGLGHPLFEDYIFPAIGIPALASAVLLTCFFLLAWVPSAITSRRRANLGLAPVVVLGLLVVVIPFLLFLWKAFGAQ